MRLPLISLDIYPRRRFCLHECMHCEAIAALKMHEVSLAMSHAGPHYLTHNSPLPEEEQKPLFRCISPSWIYIMIPST